jgi:hypothetical protein
LVPRPGDAAELQVEAAMPVLHRSLFCSIKLVQICALHHSEVGHQMARRSGGEVARVLRALAGFAIIFALIWLCLYEVQQKFPYIQTGSDVIFQIKLRREHTPHLFQKPDVAGVLFFGNSKALSGFIPDEFDAAMEGAGRATESYNLGLPAYSFFVDRLESILAAGNVPKYILITAPWSPDPERADLFHFIRHDSQTMNELFPFHLMARDVMMAAIASMRSRGSLNYYASNRAIVERMIADRGYFFIFESSTFPHNQLPANFRTPLDRPQQVAEREATTHDREFQKLNRLLESYHVTCLIVPLYFRFGQVAQPPPENQRLQAELASYPAFKLLGPDYVLLDNRYFSDAEHLNPDGARLYTRYLAGLVAPSMR